MKILQTIAGFGAHSGGTSTCTYDLLSAMHRIGCDVDLMTLSAPDLMGHGEPWIKALPTMPSALWVFTPHEPLFASC